MYVEQYAYFAVLSSELSANKVAERVGLRADHVNVRGKKDRPGPPYTHHMWALLARRRDEPLDAQVEEVLSRVFPIEDALQALLPDLGEDGGCKLGIFRYLIPGSPPRKPGTPLGFRLDAPVLQLLARLNTVIEVDEFDHAEIASWRFDPAE